MPLVGALHAAFPDEPEGIMTGGGGGVGASASSLTLKGGKPKSVKKFKKYSETENRLKERYVLSLYLI